MTNHLLELIKRLVEFEIEFVVCGGVACVLQGCDRVTLDVDVYIPMNRDNLTRLVSMANSAGLHPRNPEPIESLLSRERREQWINEKNALVYTLRDSSGMIQLDIFLDYPISWEELRSTSDPFEIDGIRFLVSSRRNLIRAKEAVRPIRAKDIEDIKQLKELISDESD